jgi:prepilin-type N-terminal cleavage/methylation domain-containing protein
MIKKNRGFTLIELLVVIAIIGILSSVVLASLNSARQKSRDAKRISDIKQLQLALELSFDTNNSYPAAIGIADLVTPGYISAIPQDPSTAAAYTYAQIGSGTGYVLRATLEQITPPHTALAADIDGTVQGVDCDDGVGAYCAQP